MTNAEKMMETKKYRHQAYTARNLKGRGMSNLAIAREMGLSARTVARRLELPAGPEEKLSMTLEKLLRESRDELLHKIIGTPEYADVFGPEAHGIRVEDATWRAGLDTSDPEHPIMLFEMQFSAKKTDVHEE